jgi:hypothetical protein
MAITSQITVSFKPDLSASLLNLDAIKPGKILKIKILELRGDRALIDFGKFRATADIKVPVALGEELRVRVLESGRQLKMSVIDLEPKDPQTTTALSARQEEPAGHSLKKAQLELKQIINQVITSQASKNVPQSIVNILNGLSAHFETIELKEIVSGLMPRIKSYIENSGFFLEKALENSVSKSTGGSESLVAKQLVELPEVKHTLNNDLKANLLTLKFLMEDREALQKFFTPRAQATLGNAINNLLSDITQQQGRAVSQLDSAEPFQVFSYELPVKEDGQTARLKVYYQKKQKSDSSRGFRMSLLLSMDRLGDLRTDFFLLAKDLAITFYVKDDSVRLEFQENFMRLQELLQGFFNQILMKVIVSEKKISNFDREDFQVTSDRLVDLRI